MKIVVFVVIFMLCACSAKNAPDIKKQSDAAITDRNYLLIGKDAYASTKLPPLITLLINNFLLYDQWGKPQSDVCQSGSSNKLVGKNEKVIAINLVDCLINDSLISGKIEITDFQLTGMPNKSSQWAVSFHSAMHIQINNRSHYRNRTKLSGEMRVEFRIDEQNLLLEMSSESFELWLADKALSFSNYSANVVSNTKNGNYELSFSTKLGSERGRTFVETTPKLISNASTLPCKGGIRITAGDRNSTHHAKLVLKVKDCNNLTIDIDSDGDARFENTANLSWDILLKEY